MKKDKKDISSIIYIVVVVCLITICITGSVSARSVSPLTTRGGDEPVTVETKLVQSKVLKGADGKVSMVITLNGGTLPVDEPGMEQPVDLIVVLDRSGSMSGQKIHDARRAVMGLVERLSPTDRFALISYANNVFTHSSLLPMDHGNTRRLIREISTISAGGGTNLGGGLQQGVNMFTISPSNGRQRKIILISDGLANQGVTDPVLLGAMASNGPEYNFSVSSVGVGYDFNEVLMTTIADHGAGNYYFLEDPEYFASVFEREFRTARSVVATGIEIHIHLGGGVRLLNGGGYPIRMEGDTAIIRPGDLLSGQKRSFYLTYAVPTSKERSYSLGNIELQYTHKGVNQNFTHKKVNSVICVPDKKEVLTSLDKEAWSQQVIKEDYNQMKNQVADAIRSGKKEEALKRINEYESRNRDLNASVGSASVSDNLDNDVKSLRQSVEETFTGAPAAVMKKQKQQSKALQYESYKIRRDKQ